MEEAISEAKELLKELEGLYLKPYQCPAGKWTIGYGHNLEANGLTVVEAKKVNFDADIIALEIIERWRNSGISTREIKDILPKCINAIRMSEETADYILANDINSFVSQLSQYEYFNGAPDNVKVALICICFQCGFVGMKTNIYIMARQMPFSGNLKPKKVYFIDAIRQKEYNRASALLRNASVFNTTKKRAIKMADLIYTD